MLLADSCTKLFPNGLNTSSTLNDLRISFQGVFGNLEIHGLNKSVYWTRLSKTADPGSNVIYLQEAVDWKSGEEIVIAPTSFEPYDTEIYKIGALAIFVEWIT